MSKKTKSYAIVFGLALAAIWASNNVAPIKKAVAPKPATPGV